MGSAPIASAVTATRRGRAARAVSAGFMDPWFERTCTPPALPRTVGLSRSGRRQIYVKGVPYQDERSFHDPGVAAPGAAPWTSTSCRTAAFVPPSGGLRPKIALLVTCVVDAQYPPVGMATVEVLDLRGSAGGSWRAGLRSGAFRGGVGLRDLDAPHACPVTVAAAHVGSLWTQRRWRPAPWTVRLAERRSIPDRDRPVIRRSRGGDGLAVGEFGPAGGADPVPCGRVLNDGPPLFVTALCSCRWT